MELRSLFHTQIGSYYGSEVCGLDVDQDGITDVLLVAAPMFLGSGNKEAGRVYIYSLSGVINATRLVRILRNDCERVTFFPVLPHRSCRKRSLCPMEL